MHSVHKDARIEYERRFLLNCFPGDREAFRGRQILDSYIDGTALRLREQKDEDGSTVYKLTQKIPSRGDGGRQGYITTMYLGESEFHALQQLPAKTLRKIRFSVPPFGVDVFQDELQGLITAEAEFDSAEDAGNLVVPSFILHEVTMDERFTGGRLVRASREQLQSWLKEYGIEIESV